MFNLRTFNVPTIPQSIPFIFLALQTYLHNGGCSTLLGSIPYALFSSRRRVYPLPVIPFHYSPVPFFLTSLPRCFLP